MINVALAQPDPSQVHKDNGLHKACVAEHQDVVAELGLPFGNLGRRAA